MPKHSRFNAMLKRFLKDAGVDFFGVADISVVRRGFILKQELVRRCHRAVCLGLGLSGGVLEDVQGEPTRLYFHHYRTVNAFLDQVALRLAAFLQRQGYCAVPIPASQIVDWQNQKAHLSHKQIGFLAGLGWIGRNNLLVNPRFGSQHRLVSVLTDMPLIADRPLEAGCADCRLCLDACPCGAIKEDPKDFDHKKCFEQLKDFQRRRLSDQYVCGVCVRACRGRPSKKAFIRRLPRRRELP